MSFTYDFVNAPLISYPRLLIADTNASEPIFQDNEILAAYVINQGFFQSSMFWSGPSGQNLPSSPVSYLRVAALLLDSMAANKAYLASIKSVLDVKLDSSDAAKMLMQKADAYRRVEDESGAFFVIEQVFTSWGMTDRYWKQIQRQSGIGGGG